MKDELEYLKQGIINYKNGDHDLALENFHNALIINSENYHANNNLGNFYFAKQEYDKAIVYYNKILTLDLSSSSLDKEDSEYLFDAYFKLGLSYSHIKNIKLSNNAFKHALEIKPNDASLNTIIGDRYYKLKKYKLAIAYYYKSISFSDDIIIDFYNYNESIFSLYDKIISCYIKDKNFEFAIKTINKVVLLIENKINKKNDSSNNLVLITAQLAFNKEITNCYKLMEDYETAINLCKKAVISAIISGMESNDYQKKLNELIKEPINKIKNILFDALETEIIINSKNIENLSDFNEIKSLIPKCIESPTAPIESDVKYQLKDIQDLSDFNKTKLSTPKYMEYPIAPKESDAKYQIELNIFQKLNKLLGNNQIQDKKELFENDFSEWKIEKSRIQDLNIKLKANYEKDLQKREEKLKVLQFRNKSLRFKEIQDKKELFESDFSEWKIEKLRIKDLNLQIRENYEDSLKKWEEEKILLYKQKEINENYLNKKPNSIVTYLNNILDNSKYPNSFKKDYKLAYNPNNKTLVVDYLLPNYSIIPKCKEIKYIKSREEFKESFLAELERQKLYDDLLYQISLRSLYELYKADTINAIESIVFNGWVSSIDKATGNEINTCILSLQANKQEFILINLANVEPKECFKKLKGICSSKLHDLVAIQPIIQINRKDKRFVASYDVTDKLNESINLAAMDWQDFENLIREVFEKVFSKSGGEVKITQASRDGGVDAIAFDPDPIRGGKIVIQAKRYTNTVGVSAVRDLYGTLMNEGATKGILITTSDYGPDSYDFAKGKPITLLNGNNLLYLLEQHGHKARIDLKEAKKLLLHS